MKGYVVTRLAFMALMLGGLLGITFVISHVAPGDPARLAAGPDATASMVETWGAMISHGRNYLPTWWWYSAFPGLFIYLTVLGFNLLGDGLRDVLDPKSSTTTGPLTAGEPRM